MTLDLNLKISWQSNQHIALALSGGIDSMVLYHLLTTHLRDTYEKLTVIHVNHNLREASKKEAAYIKEMTEKDEVPCHMTTLNFQGEFSQASGRRARYQYFKDITDAHQIDWLLMGHHQDDQVETVLQQVLSGRYLFQNLGIPENRQGELNILRPLMDVTKKAIKEYQHKYQVKYFEDNSNLSDDYTRNYIRHHVVPAIVGSDSLDISHLLSLKTDVNELSEIATNQAEDFLKKDNYQFSRAAYKNHPDLLRIYILNTLLNHHGEYASRKILETIDVLLIDGPSQSSYKLKYHHILIEYDRVSLKKDTNNQRSKPLFVEESGKFIYNDYRIDVDMNPSDYPLYIRSKQDGDRVPLKQGGHKKLSRLFIDKKIPASEREIMPVVESADGIIIAVGSIYNIIEPSENRTLRIKKE